MKLPLRPQDLWPLRVQKSAKNPHKILKKKNCTTKVHQISVKIFYQNNLGTCSSWSYTKRWRARAGGWTGGVTNWSPIKIVFLSMENERVVQK